MITPEEDFETWCIVVTSTIDTVSSFEPFVPQIQDLMNQLIENREFKDPIKGKESGFIKELYWKIIPKLKKLGALPENEILIILNCFKAILNFTIQALEKEIPDYFGLIHQLIPDESWSLISKNPNANIDKELIEYIKEENVVDKIMKFLDKKTDSYPLIIHSTQSMILLQKHISEIDLNDVSKKFTTHACEIAKERIRQIVPNDIYQILDKITKILVEDESVFGWLNLFEIFTKCEIFNIQLFGYQAFKYMLDQKDLQPIVLKWFLDKEHLSLLKKNAMHPEIMQYIASIIASLVKENLISFDIIQDLWNQNSQIHPTDLDKFYQMFILISKYIPVEYLFDFCSMCIHPNEKNQIWFQFLLYLAHTIGSRNDALEQYEVIRNEFWNLSFEENDLQEQARIALKTTIGYHLTPNHLKEISSQILDTFPTFEAYDILGTAINALALPDNDSAVEFLKRAIDTLQDSEEETKLPIFNFINNLCVGNSVLIDEEDCQKIFALSHDKDLYNFLQEAVENDIISLDEIRKFLNSIDFSEIDQSFIDLVKIVMQKSTPETGITSIPFDGDEILWKLSVADHPQRTDSMDLLVRTYLNIDKNFLSDYDMIDGFIKKWLSVFKQSENKHLVLDILRFFIVDAEYLVDYEIYSRTPHGLEVAPKVNVEITGSGVISTQKHIVPENMTIAVLSRRVARYGKVSVGSFTLKIAGKELTSISTIKDYAQNGDLKITAYPSTNQKVVDRIFAELPSDYVADGEIPSILYDLLKDDVKEAKLVLDCIPTMQYTLAIIESIQYLEHFNYKHFLPVEYPMLFMYNFETLIAMVEPGVLLKTGGIDYLIDCMSKIQMTTNIAIINFFETKLSSKDKKYSAQKIFDSLFSRLYNNFDDEKIYFTVIANFLMKIEKLKGVDIALPLYFPDAARKFFLCQNRDIMKLTDDLFMELTINQDILIPLVFECPDENKGIILKTVSFHLDTFSQELFDMIMSSLDDDNCKYLNDALACMLEMVKIGIDGDHASKLSNRLIQKYLQIDGTCDKSSFLNACRILGRLNTFELEEHIKSLHHSMHPVLKWSTNGDCPRKSPLGSGLMNLGATCFLNSALQQFFYIIPLRKAVLSYEGDDIFMMSLKTLYSRMLLSRHYAQSPADLVSKWVGWDGEPMNPMMQQDTCEFVQNLLDKLEKALGVDFIQKLFQGKTVHHTEGLNCDFHSESEEPFYAFSMPVKGVSSIQQSLEQLSAPDFFTGDNQYKSDKYGKIDAKRYSSIGNCPPFLIIQLARFEYNYATWTRTKIDSIYNFPVDLKFGGFDYKLNGVIVHIGTADFGHYVSYVKDRETDTWRFCNDDNVTFVSEKSILEAGIGNSSKSAYLLFYDRVDYDYDKADYKVSDEMKETIEKENVTLDEINILFSTPYFKLMSITKDNNSLFYMCHVLPYTIFQEKAPKFFRKVTESIKDDENMKKYLIELIEDKSFSKPLFFALDQSIRNGAQKIFKVVKNEVTEKAITSLFSEIEFVCENYNSIENLFSVLKDCVQTEIGYKTAIDKNWQFSLHSIISKRIPDYIAEKKNIKKDMFFGYLDLTSLLTLMSLLPIDDQLKTFLESDDFIKEMFSSKTTIESLTKLLKSANYDEEKLDAFLDKNSVSLSYAKVVEFILRMCENGFDKIDKFTFIVGERMSTLHDKFACFCYLVKNRQMSDFFLSNIDRWFNYIVNEDQTLRTFICYLVAFIIPTEYFGFLPYFPQCEFDQEEMEFKSSKEVDIEKCQVISGHFTSHLEELLDGSEDKYKTSKSVFLSLFEVFAGCYEIDKNKENINSIIKILDCLRPISVDYDTTVQKILSFLSKNGFHVKASDFIRQPNQTNFCLSNMFINALISHLSAEGLDETSSYNVFKYFGEPLNRIQNNNGILQILTLAAKCQPQIALKYLNETEMASNNYLNQLTIMKSANITKPVLNKLNDFICQIKPPNVNSIVEDSFLIHGENKIDRKWLEPILDEPLLAGHAKYLIYKNLGLEEEDCRMKFFIEETKSKEIPSEKICIELIQAAKEAIECGLDPKKLSGLSQLCERLKDKENFRELTKELRETLEKTEDSQIKQILQ